MRMFNSISTSIRGVLAIALILMVWPLTSLATWLVTTDNGGPDNG